MAKNTIKLKKYSDVIEEFVADAAITPGMLVALNASGAVIPHGEAAGNAIPMFALEDELQGKTIDDAYAADDPVQVWIAGRGDIVNAIANESITAGAFLVSAGNGKLKPVGEATEVVTVTANVSATDATISSLELDLTDLSLTLTESDGTYTGTGTGKAASTASTSAELSATFSGTGTGSVAVDALAIVGQALAAASSGDRVAVRII